MWGGVQNFGLKHFVLMVAKLSKSRMSFFIHSLICSHPNATVSIDKMSVFDNKALTYWEGLTHYN